MEPPVTVPGARRAGQVLDVSRVATIIDRGVRGLAKTRAHWHAPVSDRRTKDRLTDGQRAFNRLQAGLRTLVEQAIGQLANAWSLRRWRGLPYRVWEVFRDRRRAGLPGPLAPPGPNVNKHHEHPHWMDRLPCDGGWFASGEQPTRPRRRAGQADGGDGASMTGYPTQLAEAAALAGGQGEVDAGDAQQGSDQAVRSGLDARPPGPLDGMVPSLVPATRGAGREGRDGNTHGAGA
jgi:hypothetical protein